jgi:hypothetical protein
MKKIILIAVFCAAVFSPARAYWSYKYWYCPVSWSEARVYFQADDTVDPEFFILYVGGEGPLPDSNEDNTTTLPFQYALGHLPSSRLPWRKGGDITKIDYGLGYTHTASEIICVEVGEGITHIGNWWFAGLYWLEGTFLPLTLQSIGEGAFKGCAHLFDVLRFDTVLDVSGKYYKMSEAPLTIGSRAFADCKNLKYFNITANSTLGDEVFADSGLESVEFKPGTSFGKSVFQNCSNLKSVTIPANVNFGKYTFQYCRNLKSITFRGRTTEVTEGMFYGCSGLPSVTIPNSITSIGNSAFEDCYSLLSVTIPNSVTSIGDCAFYCSGLTSVTIPGSVTKLGARAFKQTGLTSLTVPGSVKNIEVATCAFCGNLTSVKFCEGVKSIGFEVFQDCKKLETVNLPASLDTVESRVFANCFNLKVFECNGMTPPAMHSDAFAESNLTEATLYVPSGSVNAYRNAPVWKNFKNIGTYPAGIHIINGKNFTVNSGSKVKLTAKLTPHDAVPAVVWTSSNESTVSVVDGTVTAHAPGEVIITATTGNGIHKDSCKITVK